MVFYCRYLHGNGEWQGTSIYLHSAISILVNCETQEEVDELWEKLSEGGETGQVCWLKNKFGVSWQMVPNGLGVMLQDKDAKKSERVMEGMLQLKKIDIEGLNKSYAGYWK